MPSSRTAMGARPEPDRRVYTQQLRHAQALGACVGCASGGGSIPGAWIVTSQVGSALS
jgi:hypothetical protein